MCLLARLAVRAEACKVELAERLADMSLRADWPEGAEAFFVMWAGREFG